MLSTQVRGAALRVLMWKDPRNTFSEEREVLSCVCGVLLLL